MILVDTSVWIDFLDGTKNLQTEYFIQTLESESPIFYTGLILQEVLQGFHQSRDRQIIKKEFNKLLFISPTIEDHIKGANIFTECRAKGYTIYKSIDCLIAALAIQYKLVLLDRDKDYKFIANCFPLMRVE